MSICSCGSPAHCCQPAVAGGFIYADVSSELNTHLAPQALFCSEFSWARCHCYKLSPFQAHWGRWHCTSFLSSMCLFTVHVGSGSSPLSCGVFLPKPLLQAFPLLVAGCVPPLLPSPASLWGISPSHLLGTQGAPPSLLRAFFVVIAYSVSLFSLVRVGLSRGLAQGCLWEYHVPL
jgi:hypothetical protein